MNNEAVLEAIEFSTDVYTQDRGRVIKEDDYGYGFGFDLKVQLVESNDFLTITFRGTTGFENALTDLSYSNLFVNNSLKQVFKELHISNEDDATAHQGFTRALRMLYPDLKYEIQKNPLPLRLYGHSLGGALASLCAYVLALDKSVVNRIDTVITFGSPRVFFLKDNPDIIRKYNQRVPNYFRFCNQNDIVSFVPFNERVSPTKITSNDVLALTSISTRFSQLFRVALESITSLFNTSVTQFTHVGDCYILDHSTYQHIGIRDEGRNVSDISRYSLTQYASLFSTKNVYYDYFQFLGGAGIGVGVQEYLTLTENFVGDQSVINIARKYLGVSNIGYDYVKGTLEADPLFQKLLRTYGSDNDIVEALGILQYARIKRGLYQKHLLNPQGGLYSTYFRFIKNKMKTYSSFKKASFEEQSRLVDIAFEEWVQSDKDLPEIFGRNTKKLRSFYAEVRRAFLKKLNLADFKRKVKNIDTFWNLLIFAGITYIGIWSYFFYEQATTGVLGHQMALYKHNYLRFYSRNQQIPKRKPSSIKLPEDDIIQLPNDDILKLPESLETPYHHPQGFIYTDRIGSFVLF